MADYVLAVNIAARAAVKQSIVGETLISTYKPTEFIRWYFTLDHTSNVLVSSRLNPP